VTAVAGRLRRRRGDPSPSTSAPVMIVLVGGTPARATVKRAVAEAAGAPIAVITVLRIFGSAWGFPNPGLLPNATEKAEATRIVEATIAAIERHGGSADGQITATRHPAKVIVGAARRRSCRLVLVERTPSGRVRSAIEGDVGLAIRRRLRGDAGVTVEVIDRRVSTSAVRSSPKSKP
jgi:hypothetical protein